MTPDERAADITQRRQPAMSNGAQVQHKIWVRDDWAYYPIWQVPIERLLLNVDNKRFSAEKELVEHALGRALDPSNTPADEESIIAILCDSSIDVDLERQVAVGTPSKDSVALRDDWSARGQAEPLWIRSDGTVRNGNRRLAMLKRLQAAGADVHWVDAIVLTSEDVDESELFRMEQREQLAENFKKRYQDVNALLALKDAAELENIDWDDPHSIAVVANRLKHYAGRDDAAYASKQLYAIRALDAYLSYINAEGRYSLAAKQVEVFREVGLCMSSFEDEPDQQFELLQAAFAFVLAGRRYGEIRQLRNLFSSDRALFDAMVARILATEDSVGWDADVAANSVELPELSDATSPDDEAEEDGDGSGAAPLPGSTSYPRGAVAEIIEGSLDRFAAGKLDVRKQLEQAVARVESVDLAKLAALVGDERSGATDLIARLDAWAAQATQRVR